jgi:hypothetical protein
MTPRANSLCTELKQTLTGVFYNQNIIKPASTKPKANLTRSKKLHINKNTTKQTAESSL